MTTLKKAKKKTGPRACLTDREMLTIALPRKTKEAIVAYCEMRDISLSQGVREAIEAYLETNAPVE